MNSGSTNGGNVKPLAPIAQAEQYLLQCSIIRMATHEFTKLFIELTPMTNLIPILIIRNTQYSGRDQFVNPSTLQSGGTQKSLHHQIMDTRGDSRYKQNSIVMR